MEEKNQPRVEKPEAAPAGSNSNVNGSKPGHFGLDVGTSRIVAASGPLSQESRSQLNAFVAVQASDMAENVLKQRSMVYERNCRNIYVYGNDSDFFASFLNTEARRPMQFGLLNPQEEMGQHMIELIMKRLLPQARKGETICFSVPGRGENANGNLVYHEAVLKSMLQGMGYTAKSVNEGQAVVFSELQEENFTGIGISFGGGMCNVSISFMSLPMITFSVPKGGDYVDHNVAEVLNESPTRVRLHKEERLDLGRPAKDDLGRALHIYYEDLLQSVVGRLRAELRSSGQLPKIDRPMPIVLAGGTAKPAGFLQKFESALREGGEFPIELSDVRMARDPLTATARGCYIAAMSEAK